MLINLFGLSSVICGRLIKVISGYRCNEVNAKTESWVVWNFGWMFVPCVNELIVKVGT